MKRLGTLRNKSIRTGASQAKESWLKKYVKENPLKVGWLSLLCWGTLSLFSYFQYIDYFPNFDLQAAVNVLLSLAYIAIIVSTLFSVAMLLPSFGVLMVLRAPARTAKSSRFISELFEWGLYSYLSLFTLTSLSLLYLHLEWELGYALQAYFFCAVLLFAIRARLVPRTFSPRTPPAEHASRRVHMKKWQRRLYRYRQARLGSYLFIAMLQTVPFFILLMTLEKASNIKTDDYSGIMLAATEYAVLLAVVGCGLVYVVKKERKYWYAVFPIALLLPLIATMCCHATGMLPMMVAQRTKIGNFHVGRLTLANKSCPAVAAALGQACDDKQTAPIQLCNIHVMSRIGSEAYVRLADSKARPDGQHNAIPLLLPSADLLSMQIDFKNKTFRVEQIDDDLGKASSICTAVP